MAAFLSIHTKLWQVCFYAVAALLVGGEVTYDVRVIQTIW